MGNRRFKVSQCFGFAVLSLFFCRIECSCFRKNTFNFAARNISPHGMGRQSSWLLGEGPGQGDPKRVDQVDSR